jgi:hypothetical protein
MMEEEKRREEIPRQQHYVAPDTATRVRVCIFVSEGIGTKLNTRVCMDVHARIHVCRSANCAWERGKNLNKALDSADIVRRLLAAAVDSREETACEPLYPRPVHQTLARR